MAFAPLSKYVATWTMSAYDLIHFRYSGVAFDQYPNTKLVISESRGLKDAKMGLRPRSKVLSCVLDRMTICFYEVNFGIAALVVVILLDVCDHVVIASDYD